MSPWYVLFLKGSPSRGRGGQGGKEDLQGHGSGSREPLCQRLHPCGHRNHLGCRQKSRKGKVGPATMATCRSRSAKPVRDGSGCLASDVTSKQKATGMEATLQSHHLQPQTRRGSSSLQTRRGSSSLPGESLSFPVTSEVPHPLALPCLPSLSPSNMGF